MSKQEIERYFKEYIIEPKGFIFNDIKREIDWARCGKGGGNFLAALGLLCYTEFMGRILEKGIFISYKHWFNAFLTSTGEPYRRLIDVNKLNIYHDLRCGMAHAYFAGNCEIAMLNNNYPAGIIIKPDGKYLFIVEKYFEDFMNACKQLYNDMIQTPGAYPCLPST